MKHIKKYNEEEVDIDYIKDCFIDFQDDVKYDYEIGDIDENEGYIICIGIDVIPTPPEIDTKYSISKLVEYSNSLNNFYLDLENSIDKVKLKYPNILVTCDEGKYTSTNIKSRVMDSRYLWIRFS
jgi:hypothetical protein